MNVLQRLRIVRIVVTGSLWFVPGLCVVSGMALAISLTATDVAIGHEWVAKGSYLFGVGAEGARGTLSAIAGSMMTVASLTFSLNISTLATAASQYTSRLVRNFLRDRVNQFVLGFFVGLFAYCLVVLRSIRDTDEGAFVPSLAVFGGLLLALVSIGVLIYFIHHIAESIQAWVVFDRVTGETVRAIEHLSPPVSLSQPGARPTRGTPPKTRAPSGIPSRPAAPVTRRAWTPRALFAWPRHTKPSCLWKRTLATSPRVTGCFARWPASRSRMTSWPPPCATRSPSDRHASSSRTDFDAGRVRQRLGG